MKSWLRTHLQALGAAPLPMQIEADGAPYTLRQVFKHDFFAATAMYQGDAGKIVLKIERVARLFIFPMAWLGRFLAARECDALERLRDLEGIPAPLGRFGATGFLRRFVEGRPLGRNEYVGDEFHPRLRRLIDAIHARGMAYVDLEKSENVLVGDDGRPYLFDFQIAWCWSKERGGELWPMQKIRAWLQQGDLYHLVKLQRRTRPDQLTPDAIAASYRKPWHVRLYRWMFYPLLWLRRRILAWLEAGRPKDGERGRVVTTGD